MDTRRGGGIGVGSGDGEFTRAFGRLWLALLLKNSELVLAFPAFGGRNPSAFNMGDALEAAALAASAAAHVGTVLLGLVTAVLAAHTAARAAAHAAAAGGEARSGGRLSGGREGEDCRRRVKMMTLLLDLVLLP